MLKIDFFRFFDFVTPGVEESLNRKNEISKQELRAERQGFEREMDTHALRISMECFTIMRISLRMLDLTVLWGLFFPHNYDDKRSLLGLHVSDWKFES